MVSAVGRAIGGKAMVRLLWEAGRRMLPGEVVAPSDEGRKGRKGGMEGRMKELQL